MKIKVNLDITFEIFLTLYSSLNSFKGGGATDYLDEILRYNGTTNKWLNAGKMTTSRSFHSVALMTDISKVCPVSGHCC